MAKELIVSLNGREKKIAIIENEKVTEFYIERGENNQGIVGNIYKGRVMRVLPGMQSAFVDIGLERDAFLYVSDFFDEEEEFERIVLDKSKKGEVDAGRAAAEQIALARVEREQHIEATQARAEPLLDEEETAANGEMFKDARLQERIFDQIHAVEFNLGDDFRTAVVGSVLPSGSYQDASFQRVDDSDISEQSDQMPPRTYGTVAAHVERFVDEIDETPPSPGTFERVSDEEETEQAEAVTTTKKKRATRKALPTKTKKASSRSASPKKSGKPAVEDGGSALADSEARITGNRSRG